MIHFNKKLCNPKLKFHLFAVMTELPLLPLTNSILLIRTHPNNRLRFQLLRA